MTPSSLTPVINEAVQSALRDLDTCTPGRIGLWNPITGTASVETAVRRATPRAGGGFAYEAMPVLPAVPVYFPGGTGSKMNWLALPGDPVLVFAGQWDHSMWTGGSPVEPVDVRTHHYAHAIAVAVSPSTGPLPAAGMVIDDPVSIALGGAAATPLASNALVLIELAKIAAALTALGGSYVPAPTVGTVKVKGV